ncbi:MAG: DUF4382 domain-containing protein [Pirellulaceae bacterium]|jgi:hypothetical protein|nr:DUF4382 domain-containing protein [Pirellulaceae bacterium]
MKTLALIAAALMLAACGGGGGGGTPPASAGTPATGTPTTATSPVQINLGDDPADRLMAVNVTVNSVALHRADGQSVTVLSSPRPMELMHLMGTVAPLAVANVPHGTYTGATMTFGGATVMHMDPASGQPLQRQVAGPMTSHVSFGSPLVVGTGPMVVNFDMNMWASVGIDSAGNVSLSPSLSAHHSAAIANSQHHEQGGLHGLVGVVGGTGTNAFTLSMMQGLSGIPLTTHTGTHFEGMAGQHMMGAGQVVSVDASLQPDGTWIASHVQSHMASGGALSSGVVATVTGAPPTQLVLVMHDGAGSGMAASSLAGSTTVSVGDATTFAINGTSVDLTNLPFTPRFDRASVSAGQRIEALSTSQWTHGGGMHGMTGGGTLTASSVRLAQQGLRGTVSGYTPAGNEATFVLTVPADAVFAKLTGKTSITVYQRAATLLTPANVSNGSVVQVRGLLFNDAGTLRLVASRVRT